MFCSPPPSSSSFFPSRILFPLPLLILIFALADLSSSTIPCEEEEEEEKEEEEMYDDIDGFDSVKAGSQGRAVTLPEPTEEEEDIYEVLPGEILHLLITLLPYFQKVLTW